MIGHTRRHGNTLDAHTGRDVTEHRAHGIHLHAVRRAHRDDAQFMRHTMAYREGDSIRLDYKPVVQTRYQPMERKY